LRKIGRIKPEIRILALTGLKNLRGKPILAGAIFRGKFWLDGIIFKWVKSKEKILEETSKTIRKSPHYGQIRIIILDGKIFKGEKEEFQNLFRKIRKPIIILKDKKPKSSEKKSETRFLEISVVIGLDSKKAEEVVRLTTVSPPMPEALRVARILLETYARFLKGSVNLRPPIGRVAF
jgi:endonuclease V-like protein UPF0215 family